MDAARTLLRSVGAFFVRRWIPVTAGLVIGALVASLGVWWLVRQNDGDKVDAVDCSTLEAADFGSANALAVACDSDVEVTGERTPWQTSWANHDGSARLEMSAVPTRTMIDDQWVPIDSELVVEQDEIRMTAPAFPMSINPGGAAGAGKPLGTIERGEHVFEMWFPLELPVPTVEGSHIVYDLVDGVRLIVTVNPDTTGFIPVVELRDADAAARFQDLLEASRAKDGTPGSGIDLGFTVKVSEGLTLSIDADRQMHAADASGEDQFFAPPPSMWDSSGENVRYGPEVTEVASTDRAVQPSGGDAIAGMGVSLVGDTLVVTPNAGMLESSDTVWPVYIDPSISGVGAAERIAIRTGQYTSTLYQWTNISSSSPGQGTGYCSETSSCNVQFYQRLMWRFTGMSTIANLAGTDIQSATFTVNGVHSYNCTAREAYLYRVGDFNSATNWASSSWPQLIDTRVESQRSSCSPSTNGYRSFSATAAFVWLADANSTVMPLGLTVPESSMAYWKRYAHDATVTVNYNRAPNVPTSLQLTSPSVPSCVTGSGRPFIATATPTLSAISTDPDLTTVQTRFEVAPVTALTAPVWNSGYLTALASGSRASVAVPASTLTSGTAYAWRARAFDGTRYSDFSGWCEFTVDATTPSTPSVSPVLSGFPTIYDTNTNVQYGGVGQQGAFTLKRATADTDVVLFRYGFNAPSLPNTATPATDGSFVVTFTPTVAGPVTLSVRVEDAAGNFSPVRNYVFTVATATEDGVWTFDEGSGQTAHDTAGSPARPIKIYSSGMWSSGPHALFDSRPGDGALLFDGVGVEVALADGPVVTTTESFAVSAHVLLGELPAGRSAYALSQDAPGGSGFRLGYAATCPGTPDGCWAFRMPDSLTGSSETSVFSPVPVVTGEWTHLVGEFDLPSQTMRLWVCPVGSPSAPAIGEPVKSEVSRTATPWAATGLFRVGSYFLGKIDNVRVFSGEVVSEAKIRRLCQGAEATDFTTGDTALDPTTTVGG